MNQRGFINIILVVLVVVLAGVVGYVTLVKKPTTIREEPTNAQNIQPIPPTSAIKESTFESKDETINWKVCNNIKSGYEIQYPSNWKIWYKSMQGIAEADCNNGDEILVFSKEKPGPAGETSNGFGIKFEKANIQSIDSYIAQQISPERTFRETIIIDGEKALWRKDPSSSSSTGTVIIYLAPRGNLFKILTKANQVDNIEFNKIISSLKFK